MTDNETRKALECCTTRDGCKSCPRSYNGEMCRGDTPTEMIRDALDLINRLEAENEKLIDHIEYLEIAQEAIKNCAVKEFAERLKQDIKDHRLEMNLNGLKGTHRTDEMTYETIIEYIDNIKKEMAGE